MIKVDKITKKSKNGFPYFRLGIVAMIMALAVHGYLVISTRDSNLGILLMLFLFFYSVMSVLYWLYTIIKRNKK